MPDLDAASPLIDQLAAVVLHVLVAEELPTATGPVLNRPGTWLQLRTVNEMEMKPLTASTYLPGASQLCP